MSVRYVRGGALISAPLAAGGVCCLLLLMTTNVLKPWPALTEQLQAEFANDVATVIGHLNGARVGLRQLETTEVRPSPVTFPFAAA